jgi:hypothetical protein
MAKDKADYIGKRFGLLKVISCVTPSDGVNNGGSWLCMCKCKRMITLSGYRLHSRKSCGCLSRKAAVERGKLLRKTDEEKAMNLAYRGYKKYAPIPILDKHQWVEILKKSCHYCNQLQGMGVNGKIIIADDEQVGCCSTCYTMRGSLTDDKFIAQVQRIWEVIEEAARQ